MIADRDKSNLSPGAEQLEPPGNGKITTLLIYSYNKKDLHPAKKVKVQN
jgi:hypothetical protein